MAGNQHLRRSQLRLRYFMLAQHTWTKEGISILCQKAKPWSSCLSLLGIFDANGHPLIVIARRREAYRSAWICIHGSLPFA
jgi:hypothetical protein